MKSRIVQSGLRIILFIFIVSSVYAVDWVTDFNKASADAKSSGKYMLLDFSGSDWCGWCIKLEKEVFSKSEFSDYAAKKFICVLVDFPNSKPQTNEVKVQNAQLAKKFGIRGYPTIIILNSEGNLVAQTGYQSGGPANYVAHLESLIKENT